MQLMDMVTAYSYMDLVSEKYMKLLDGLLFPELSNSKPHNAFSIRLELSLYRLK